MIRQKQDAVKNTAVQIDWPPPPSSFDDETVKWYESLKGVIQNAINSASNQTPSDSNPKGDLRRG